MKKRSVERVVFQFHVDIEQPSNMEHLFEEFKDLVIDGNDNYELIQSHCEIECKTLKVLPLKQIRSKYWDKWMWLFNMEEN